MDFKIVEWIVKESLKELKEKDGHLLESNASERSITHRLAVYLERHFWSFHVDCEYNRQEFDPKKRWFFKEEIPHIDPDWDPDILVERSIFPDIIVHKRGDNSHNILVIELKKDPGSDNQDWDRTKLRNFTKRIGEREYSYEIGVFIIIYTEGEFRKDPDIAWFVDGKAFTAPD